MLNPLDLKTKPRQNTKTNKQNPSPFASSLSSINSPGKLLTSHQNVQCKRNVETLFLLLGFLTSIWGKKTFCFNQELCIDGRNSLVSILIMNIIFKR